MNVGAVEDVALDDVARKAYPKGIEFVTCDGSWTARYDLA